MQPTNTDFGDIELRPLTHKDQEQIAIHFAFDVALKDYIKQYPGVRWTQTHKCFYLRRTEENLRGLLNYLAEQHISADTMPLISSGATRYVPRSITAATKKKPQQKRVTLSPDVAEEIKSFRRFLEQQRYSPATVKTYLSMVTDFFRAHTDRPWDQLTNQDIVKYNHAQFIARKKSYSTQNQFINAIKLFYRCHGKGQVLPETVERPRKERKLPNVLTRDEVRTLLTSVTNLKHRTLLSLLYACGLRIGDALHLRLEDVRAQEGLLYIRAGKGRKDRRVPLTGPMLRLLDDYLTAYQPRSYVFEGEKGGAYSYKSAQQVMKRAARGIGIRQHVTLHTLRHSYATHQLQMGTDSRYIQEILGHNDPKTTMMYTHVAMKDIKQIKSPFDDMDIR